MRVVFFILPCILAFVWDVNCQDDNVSSTATSAATTTSSSTSLAASAFCGQSRVIMPRIAGSVRAEKEDFPWLLRLMVESTISTICSATIINDRWLITAGNCVANFTNSPQSIVAVPGIMSDVEDVAAFIKIQNITLHPDFETENGTTKSDYALIQTAEKLDFSTINHGGVALQPVCLLENCSEEAQATSLCLVAGWGSDRLADSSNKVGIDSILQKTVSPLVLQEVCQGSYSVNITDNMACFGYNSGTYFDSCQGDRGGPIICRTQRSRAYYLHGISSFGASCSSDGNYRVYFKPCAVIDWIKTTTQQAYGLSSGPITRTVKTTTVVSTAESNENDDEAMAFIRRKRTTRKTNTARQRRTTLQHSTTVTSTSTTVENLTSLPTVEPMANERKCGSLPRNTAVAPWVAVVGYSSNDSEFVNQNCAAAVVGKRWLLTSKSCQSDGNLEAFLVGTGGIDRHRLRSGSGIPIQAYAMHRDKDVVLMKLTGDMWSTNASLGGLCLPTFQQFTTKACLVSGWLRQSKRNCDVLKMNLVHPDPIANNPVPTIILNDNTTLELVTIQEKIYYCDEDVGGPLACIGNDNKYSLYGIVSASLYDGNYIIVEPICKLKAWIYKMAITLNGGVEDADLFSTSDGLTDECLSDN